MSPNAHRPALGAPAGQMISSPPQLADTLKRTPQGRQLGAIPRHAYCRRTAPLERFLVAWRHYSGAVHALEFLSWPAARGWCEHVRLVLMRLPHGVPGIDPVESCSLRQLVDGRLEPVPYPWNADGTPNVERVAA